MKPRTATQTRKAKIQSRNAVFRTWVLSSLTRFIGSYKGSRQRAFTYESARGRFLLVVHRLRDGGEELFVRLGLAEALQQELGAFDLTDGREHLSKEDDLPHDLGREQHLLAARTRSRNVDGGEGASLLELAVQDH